VRRDSSCAHATIPNAGERPAELKSVDFGAGAVSAQLCSLLGCSDCSRARRSRCNHSGVRPV